MPVNTMAGQEEVDYKQKYRSLKRKLRFLIYEQECFHEELRRSQRKLLKVSRDKSFLLDRLMQYERVEESASSAESTDSSDADTKKAAQEKKQKKKAKKRKKKLTQVKPVLTQDNSEKTPMLANLAFSSTLTQQMSQQIAELMSKGTSNLPGSTSSSSSQPFAGLGATGKQSQSTLPASTSTSSQPSTSATSSLSSGNILERALQSPNNLSAISLSNQSTPTSSSPHTASTLEKAQGKKKFKREPIDKPSIHQASPKIKIEESSEAGPEDLVMDLPE